jgi:hypothetical protein
MLINLSNHPSDLWEDDQKNEAVKLYGEILDYSFPAVDPYGDENYISALAKDYADTCINIFSGLKDRKHAVHIMGEFNFCFAVVNILLKNGITCVASTSVRIAEEISLNEKISKFKFVRFREYGFG